LFLEFEQWSSKFEAFSIVWRIRIEKYVDDIQFLVFNQLFTVGNVRCNGVLGISIKG
jgi:hypothetical protein